MLLIKNRNRDFLFVFRKMFNVYDNGDIFIDGKFFDNYKTYERAKQIQTDFENFWLGCGDEKAIYYMPKE